jgi:hypothetical protein
MGLAESQDFSYPPDSGQFKEPIINTKSAVFAMSTALTRFIRRCDFHIVLDGVANASEEELEMMVSAC